MKTMKLGDTIVRVSEQNAIEYGKRGYVYCPKSEWKNKVRDLNKVLAEKRAAKKEEAKNEAKEKKNVKNVESAKDTRMEDKKKQKQQQKGKKK